MKDDSFEDTVALNVPHLNLMCFKACVLWSQFLSPWKATDLRNSPLWSQCVSHLEVDACYRMDSWGVLNARLSNGLLVDCFLNTSHQLLFEIGIISCPQELCLILDSMVVLEYVCTWSRVQLYMLDKFNKIL